MNRIRVLAVLAALSVGIGVVGAGPAAALNQLRDISVQKAGDSVVVIISTSEPCQSNPFLTDTKPERIVIDLTGVVNTWTNKKFAELPLKSIQAIRTSQYKTEPNLVTRVVLDIGRPVDFRSFQNGSDVIVKMPAATGETEFAEWHATGARPAAVRTAEKPAAAKTAEKPAAAKTAEEPVVAVEETAKVAEAEPEKPVPTEPKKKASGVEIESYPKRALVAYNTADYRDPFEPLIGGPGGHADGDLPVLENLSLVGILSNEDGNLALLEDADGIGYMLMPNDRVRNGYLVSVSDNKAIFQITEYGWTRTVAMELEIPEIK
jgi:hypothetical protein